MKPSPTDRAILPGLRSCALLALVLAVAGCKNGPATPDLSMLGPGEIVEVHTSREQAVRTLQGEVKARLESPRRSGTLRAFVIVKRPDLFRMRAFPPLGGTVFDLSIRKDSLAFYLPDEDTVYLQRLGAPKKAEPEEGKDGQAAPDLDALFGETGLARMILGAGAREIAQRYLGRESRGVKLAMVNRSGVVEGYSWLDPVSLLKARQEVLGADGETELELEFSEYFLHEKTGVWWPGAIEIRAPKKDFGLRLTFYEGDLDLNEPIEDDLFVIDAPEDAKRVER